MKTTLELPDDLLTEAKTVAARRRTTLKALIEHALRREIMPEPVPNSDLIEVGPHGMLRLKARGAHVTSEAIYQMAEDEEN